MTKNSPATRPPSSGDPVPFADFNRALAAYPPHYRCLVEAHCEATAGDWALLGLVCRDRADRYTAEPADDPPKRRRAHHGTPQSTSTASARVTFDHPHDDPLKTIPASQYLPALTGELVSSSGRIRCPRPDHEDVHPSAKCYGTEWKCFSCGAGGSIIDAASAIYGIPATGPDYWRLRDRILEALVWSPLQHEVRDD